MDEFFSLIFIISRLGAQFKTSSEIGSPIFSQSAGWRRIAMDVVDDHDKNHAQDHAIDHGHHDGASRKNQADEHLGSSPIWME